jgi:hypothetical protein
MTNQATSIKKWNIKGELILNCSCDVFCPCVISLGLHPPTEGNCQGWLGIHIDQGHYGDTDLSGLKVGMLLDIPGNMSRGGWKVGLYLDENADEAATEALTLIMSGQAKGTTGLFKILVSEILAVKKVPIEYRKEEKRRYFSIPRLIEGAIEPVPGKSPDRDQVVTNSQYWMGPDIVVSRALKGRVRDFGRAWDFDGRSAEMCAIEWSGPERS